jgi:hypothetical protein
MTRDQLIDVLARLGLTRDGDAFLPPSGLNAMVYLGVDREPIVVDHVTRIDVAANLVVVTSQRKDRIEKFGAGVESVRAVHVFTGGSSDPLARTR